MKPQQVFLRWALLVEKRLDNKEDKFLVEAYPGVDQEGTTWFRLYLKNTSGFTYSELRGPENVNCDDADRGEIFYVLYLEALQAVKNKTNEVVNKGLPAPDKFDMSAETYSQLKALFTEKDF